MQMTFGWIPHLYQYIWFNSVLLVTDITWDEDEAGILQIMTMDKCYKKNNNKTARIVRDVDKMSSSLIWTLVWHDQQIR